MLAVLLSFGAVNSLIPLLIIIMLIAAAAGLTRGYNLFAIFGIGALTGAASAAKKGSVVGRNPYRPVAAKPSSQFMPKPKSREKVIQEREERKKNKETAKKIVNDIDQQLKSKTQTPISTILKTGNYFENPKQKGKYVKLAETAANVPVPAIQTPYKGYRNKLKRNEEIREAEKAQAKKPAMAERARYLDSLTTAMAAGIEKLITSGKWDAMSEKQKIALIEKEFVRPVKGQRSRIAMASALLSGNIKEFKEELNKAPNNTKALIGIVGALATGAGVEGVRRAIINESKKMPNYGAQTQPVEGFGGLQVKVFEPPKRKIESVARFIKSPHVRRLTSFVFLGPIGWLGVTEGEEFIKRIRQRQQKATP